MRALGSLLLLLAVALYYLSAMDRQSPLALQVVELDTRLGLAPAYSLAGALGLALWGLAVLRQILDRRRPAAPARPRPPVARRGPGAPAAAPPGPAPGDGFRAQILAEIRAFDGGAGARLIVDPDPTLPLALVLEHLAPLHCERAVGALGLLLQRVPPPPRVQVRFVDCPPGVGARHHLVGRALGAVLDPGSFKAVASADHVDVLFHRPDPRWRAG